jgi:hypothetical protein
MVSKHKFYVYRINKRILHYTINLFLLSGLRGGHSLTFPSIVGPRRTTATRDRVQIDATPKPIAIWFLGEEYNAESAKTRPNSSRADLIRWREKSKKSKMHSAVEERERGGAK